MEPANDSALLNLHFENGAHGQILIDAMSHLGGRVIDMQVEIHGEEGMLETRMTFERAELFGVRHDEDEVKSLYTADFAASGQSTNPMSIFENQPIGVRYFIDCLVEDEPVTPSFYDGWKAQRVVDAAIESNRIGKWVAP